MAKQKFRKRIKFRYRPAWCEVVHEMKDPRVQNALNLVNRWCKVDAITRCDAFRMLRLDWLEFTMIFSFDGKYWNYEVFEPYVETKTS